MNKALDDIMQHVIDRLKREYGYCAAAVGETGASLHSGNETEEVIISIKITRKSSDS